MATISKKTFIKHWCQPSWTSWESPGIPLSDWLVRSDRLFLAMGFPEKKTWSAHASGSKTSWQATEISMFSKTVKINVRSSSLNFKKIMQMNYDSHSLFTLQCWITWFCRVHLGLHLGEIRLRWHHVLQMWYPWHRGWKHRCMLSPTKKKIVRGPILTVQFTYRKFDGLQRVFFRPFLP